MAWWEGSSCPAGRYLCKQWHRFFDSEADARRERYERDIASRETGHFAAPGSSELVCGAAPAVGLGFIEHGYAKLARGTPFADLLGWATIVVEIVGGSMILLGAFVPVAAVPMIVVQLVATFTVHFSNGFSSIKLLSYDAMGTHFGQPGYETDLLYNRLRYAKVIESFVHKAP
jgi:uncharacterized membrane protein YphA (DoxX/SURF4 family)